ncbi:MAG: outer membrane protein assembly factor BamA [Gammaproteobacteria bacterium]|nr:outer membrane protein assembly factor BamA [Gammaproteobacteria bacterium]
MSVVIRLIVVLVLLYSPLLLAFDAFTVKQIRIEGAERISEDTVLNYLPVKEGDKFDQIRVEQAISALFGTGFFNDVQVLRDGDTLVVRLVERPSIAKITIKGNEEISTEDLTTELKKIGLADGRVFNRSLLERVELELQRQYFSLGRYGVSISSRILEQERNRVAIDLTIDEGEVARIRQINLIGNESFSDELLLSKLNSGEHSFLALLSSSSKYSREKLQADLEIIRSYYMDRGYVNFNIESTQVSISPDKKDVFVTVNVDEGEKFFVKEVSLRGDIIIPEVEMRKVMTVSGGQVFSRKEITETSTRISERLSEEGYAFANVNPAPEFHKDEKNQVSLVFFVDPGKRVYVRRVNFTGNIKTQDEVMRREMRQLEGGWISTSKINRSKVRLQRTGFFEDNINIETPPVPGRTDVVDVNFTVVERPSGNIQAAVGYGGDSGFIVSGSVNQTNFLGTGRRVGVEVNNSQISRVFSLSLSDPYYTVDGISRSISLSSRRTNISQFTTTVGAYTADVTGASMSLGIPLSEFRSARAGLNLENTGITIGDETTQSFRDELNGEKKRDYYTLSVSGAWSYDTRNHILFADSGTYITLSADASAPVVTKTNYYKLNYRHQWYIPLFKDITMHLEGNFSYAHGYLGTELPFYENYFAGGGQSVRGFEERSLGPVEQLCNYNPPVTYTGVVPNCEGLGKVRIGGDRRVTGTAELVFPMPFSEDSRSTRFSLFVDGGYLDGPSAPNPTSIDNLWDIAREFRVSYGASFIWITPMGALRFSYALPLRFRADDQLREFQFSIGAPY